MLIKDLKEITTLKLTPRQVYVTLSALNAALATENGKNSDFEWSAQDAKAAERVSDMLKTALDKMLYK